MKTFEDSSIWKYCDTTYDIVGYNDKTRTVIISKSVRYGIYYTDIRTSKITRKLNKNNEIKLENISHNLSQIKGF